MKTSIFYCTGTGNSLWVARTLAQALGDADVVPMVDATAESLANAGPRVGLVFPVHIWGLPTPVLNMLERLKGLQVEYLFGVATNGGQVSNTLVQLQRMLADRGLTLSSGYSVVLPSNYIPWGGPGPREVQQRKFDGATAKVSSIAKAVEQGQTGVIEMGPAWQRMVFSAMYKLSLPRVPAMDKKFWVDDKCNECGICATVCPANNVTMVNDRPHWHQRCEQCLACLQWCPTKAIQYGKKTPQYERYHHPEVKLKDIIRAQD